MNRNDLKEIALVRLREAKALFDSGNYDGAYYLCGYVIECALKACIAKKTKRHDFPDKTRTNDSYTHSLTQLVRVAELQTALDQEISNDVAFRYKWTTVKDWKEGSRYERHSLKAAEDLLAAVGDARHGVLRWLRRHW